MSEALMLSTVVKKKKKNLDHFNSTKIVLKELLVEWFQVMGPLDEK